jgi:single-stranded DNA-binding protein
VISVSGEAGAKSGKDGAVYMKLDVGMSGNVTLLGGGQQQDRTDRPARQAQQRAPAQQPPASEFDDSEIPF